LLDVPHPRTPPEVLQRHLSQLGPDPLQWGVIFGRDAAVEIEVGFGKGLFLLSESRRRPETNFLGIEIERKYVLHTADRLARAHVANVRLACTDARWLLHERVADRSVAAIHVFFPDPWWKKRHHKRRLFTAEFAQQCGRVLQPGGRLNFVSDVVEYFTETCEMLQAAGDLHRLPWGELVSSGNDADFLTNFERKYRAEGRAIYRARYERIASAGSGR
jgi:tRNA (guanine-N7-)-methyltransferase